MTKHLLLASFVLTAVLAVIQPAQAAPLMAMHDDTAVGFVPRHDVGQPTTDALPDDASPAPIAPAVAPDDLSAPVLDAESLDALAGEGANTIAVITDQTLTAITAGNTITAGTVGSGAITLDQNAFSGFDGIGNFVINSGHNNTLQSSLSVSIVLAP